MTPLRPKLFPRRIGFPSNFEAPRWDQRRGNRRRSPVSLANEINYSERKTMKSVIRLKESRAGRPVRLAASAAVVLAAVGGGAGIAAGPGNAAAAVKGHKASHRLENPKFKHPKLKHGELTIVGTEASDKIALRLQTGQPGVLQVDVGDDGSADFSFARERVATIAVDAAAGDDLVRIDESNGVFTDSIPTTIDGGDGNDTIAGGKGIETLLFNGANVDEQVNLSANGNRFKFFRTQANITMDTAGVERVDFNALGGADLVTVNDLTGTDVSDVNVDLAATLGEATGDGQADSVIVNGTNGNDTINVSGDASGVAVSGLAAPVAIQHQEPNNGLAVNGLGGNDAISAATLAAQAITLTLDGGAGDDTIAGGKGIETLLGSEGNDSIDGNGGNDAAFLGDGEDTFVWDPGDGSDTIEGEDGADTMLFNGANAAEQIELSANGNRLRFSRDIANITMDTDGIELVDFNALGGADLVTVNDLTGTDVSSVNVDLAGTLGGATGDGQADCIVVNATNNDDTITVSGDAGGVTVKGIAPTIGSLHAEAANDRLEINTLAGTDTVNTIGLAAGAIQLFVDGILIP